MFGIYRYCSALPPLFLSACHDHPIEHKREELRSKSSGLVDNVIADSRSPFSWYVALLYFRVLPRGLRLPRADVDKRKTSLEIVPISKISNSRGADQKYKLNCNGKAIMYCANDVMQRPALIGILEKDKITATTIPITIPGNACQPVATLTGHKANNQSSTVTTRTAILGQFR
ncbi:hypothetical protein J6590_027062 [Homalodisca vitripennis]|nr:hypothetical protein J6590_027062 [Homalodisca vitripennis]